MANLQFSNNATSTLAAAITSSGQTSIALASGTGARFPSAPSTARPFPITLYNGANIEVCYVTARTADTLTVLRGQEGTTAQSSFAIGTVVELRCTAASLNDFSNQVALNAVVKDPTGFDDPASVTISYNSSTRVVTLTGSFKAYYQGAQVTALTNGWASTAHTATTGSWYLYYDGANFVWSQTAWTFDMLMIAYVYYGASDKFGIRECHSFLPWQAHREFHETVGTYLVSGGDLSAYVLASTTAADRRPAISSPVVADEDIRSAVTALAAGGPYTQHYLTSTGTSTFVTGAADIVPLLTANPYYNQFQTPNWIQTLLPSNAYMALWLIALPATADSGSQAYRFVWIQGQTQSGTLATIQALTFASLNLGQLTSISPEFVPIAKVIIRYATSNWTLIQVDKLTLSRGAQTGTSAGYLSSVTTNTTLTGAGTPTSPLAVNPVLAVSEVDFNTASYTPPTATVGQTYWDAVNVTLATVLDVTGNVTLQHGQEMHVRVVNKTGVQINDGQVVYVSGAQGNRPTATLAKADALVTSEILGVATQNIANNAEGFVTVFGVVNGYNTSGFTAGDTLYLSASSAGVLTNAAPASPNYLVRVGEALNSTTSGAIFVSPQPPTAMDSAFGSASNLIAPSQLAVKTYVDSKAEPSATVITFDFISACVGDNTFTNNSANATAGGKFFVARNMNCTGAKIYAANNATYRISLWNAAGSRLAYQDVGGSGVLTASWAAVALTAYSPYYVSMWQTGGGVTSRCPAPWIAQTGGPTSLPVMLNPYVLLNAKFYALGGDLFPSTLDSSWQVFPVQPVLA